MWNLRKKNKKTKDKNTKFLFRFIFSLSSNLQKIINSAKKNSNTTQHLIIIHTTQWFWPKRHIEHEAFPNVKSDTRHKILQHVL